MQTSRGRRRGANFTVRVSEYEREKLEEAQRHTGGPRNLGPWLVWSGLRANSGIAEAIATRLPAKSLLDITATRERVILDLCAGSGSWSEPYKLAGYDVRRITLPTEDVRDMLAPTERIHGVLAAPPCDQFSLARNGHPDLPRDFRGGLEIVSACLRIITAARPAWWALENPAGMLSRFLGTPRDTWQPHHFGDPWTKQTSIWGDYKVPARGPFVEPLGGGPICATCDPERRSTTWCSNSEHRAITPSGFAHAFFEANP